MKLCAQLIFRTGIDASLVGRIALMALAPGEMKSLRDAGHVDPQSALSPKAAEVA